LTSKARDINPANPKFPNLIVHHCSSFFIILPKENCPKNWGVNDEVILFSAWEILQILQGQLHQNAALRIGVLGHLPESLGAPLGLGSDQTVRHCPMKFWGKPIFLLGAMASLIVFAMAYQ
jgi:hypothetical protein